MGRAATGSVYPSGDTWYASFTIAKKRKSFAMEWAKTREQAEARCEVLAAIYAQLRSALRVDLAITVLTDCAAASEAHLVGCRQVVDGLVVGTEKVVEKPRATVPLTTFAEVARKWVEGELARDFPAHVKPADHEANCNAGRLKKHVHPVIGPIPIALLTLEDAERVLRAPTVTEGIRRHVAQLVIRVCGLAVYPLKLIERSPIPPKWLPQKPAPKAKGYLYPDEEARLLLCTDPRVPLMHRFLLGVLYREGFRASEAAALTWDDLDLKRGVIRLDANKTDDPRAWRLGEDVAEALRIWRTMRPETSTHVFEEDRRGRGRGGPAGRPVNVRHLSERQRRYLHIAGINRPELFESTSRRKALRAHDSRATFTTLALASGKTETWVADRTGHRSSTMIATYRRAARTASELGLGWLVPLHQIFPESSAKSSQGGSPPNNTEGDMSKTSSATGGTRTPTAFDPRNLNPNALPSSTSSTLETSGNGHLPSNETRPSSDDWNPLATIRSLAAAVLTAIAEDAGAPVADLRDAVLDAARTLPGDLVRAALDLRDTPGPLVARGIDLASAVLAAVEVEESAKATG